MKFCGCRGFTPARGSIAATALAAPCAPEVYVIGETGIAEELDLIGVPWIGAGDDAGKQIELKSGYALPHDPDVGAVPTGCGAEVAGGTGGRWRRPRTTRRQRSWYHQWNWIGYPR